MADKILVAYDGSSTSAKVFKTVNKLAAGDKTAQFLFVHVLVNTAGDSMGGDAYATLAEASAETLKELEAFANTLENPHEVRLLRATSTAIAINKCAEEEGCTLIVIGSRGMSGLRSLLGSVSRLVVQDSNIDVYVCKA